MSKHPHPIEIEDQLVEKGRIETEKGEGTSEEQTGDQIGPLSFDGLRRKYKLKEDTAEYHRAEREFKLEDKWINGKG